MPGVALTVDEIRDHAMYIMSLAEETR
jgi:hypothetical protein